MSKDIEAEKNTKAYKANFLWGKEDEVSSLGYEFANAKTEEYRKEIWEALTEAIQREERAKRDEVYRERDMLVSALSKVFPAYLAKHDESDETWDKEWLWIVYIEIPTRTKVVSGDQHNHVPESQWFKNETKQVSWHIHESELPLFAHLQEKENNWDGHSTEEKYRRLTALYPTNPITR